MYVVSRYVFCIRNKSVTNIKTITNIFYFNAKSNFLSQINHSNEGILVRFSSN